MFILDDLEIKAWPVGTNSFYYYMLKEKSQKLYGRKNMTLERLDIISNADLNSSV